MYEYGVCSLAPPRLAQPLRTKPKPDTLGEPSSEDKDEQQIPPRRTYNTKEHTLKKNNTNRVRIIIRESSRPKVRNCI